MSNKLMEKLDMLEPLLNAVGDEGLSQGARFLADRIADPESYITLLGETSSGKSTLINGLIGNSVLPAKTSPTTGAITEIMLSDVDGPQFYLIYKSAEIDQVEREEFLKNSEQPNHNVLRLKLIAPSPCVGFHSMRIFDTPGYGSIVDEHEEILKEFIPNSDVVIYTVQYKIGIQEEDFLFMRYLKELINEDVEIVLVINRCPANVPENDRRIREIRGYMNDIIARDVPCFLVGSIPSDDGYPLPKAENLWQYINEIVNGAEHKARLESNLFGLIKELYNKCDANIASRYCKANLDEQENEKLAEIFCKTANRIRRAVNDLVNPAFDRIIDKIPDLFDKAADKIIIKVEEKISQSNSASKDEIVAYTNSHLLPYTIQLESNDIKYYIQTELEDLNKKVDDYINKEIISFQNEVSIIMSTHTEIALKNVGQTIVKTVGENALKNVFTAFGGAGGANAGIANAASHMLKKFGDLFGKTFSRETHNNLKHILSKIGATSMKAVGIAVAVLIELVTDAIDLATWKLKLKSKISKAVQNWKKEAVKPTIDDLNELRENNIQTLRDIADDFEKNAQIPQNTNVEELNKLVELSKTIGEEIGGV